MHIGLYAHIVICIIPHGAHYVNTCYVGDVGCWYICMAEACSPLQTYDSLKSEEWEIYRGS